jgi:hypothetical protein
MVEPLRHRQTKGAGTDMSDLQPPRHISTLPDSDLPLDQRLCRLLEGKRTRCAKRRETGKE